MTIKDVLRLYHKVGLETRVRDAFVKEIIESQYKFTKEKINELKFEERITEEEFDKIKTNFSFKYIGKLYTNYRLVTNVLKRRQYGRDKKQQHKGEGTKENN